MKYFTRAWNNGDLDDKTTEEIAESYRKELEEISRTMPLAVKQLATKVNLHDAIIERVVVNQVNHRLAIYLIAGDRNIGYYSVAISYEDARIDDHNIDILKQRARDRSTCILCHEIDREKNRHYVQRLLFWPEGEISVSFSNIRLTVTRRESRTVGLAGYFVEEDSE